MDRMAHSPYALEIRALVKRFERPAVDGLDLGVRAGEFYALLGPNGAGKTTTLRMVTGLLRPDSGAITVLGVDALADPVAAKRMMAWLSDEPMIYDKLTPLEYLEFVAGLWGVEADVAEARARAARLARPRGPCAGALRGLLQGHAAEGGAGGRARA
jgi:ABC-2 type transport system ATP-binding protein